MVDCFLSHSFGNIRRIFQKPFDKFPILYYTMGDVEAWLSLVERCVRDAEAASSNLVASIGKNYLLRPVGQAVKTTPSHGVNPGSIPGEVIRCKMLWSDSEHLFLWEKAGVFDIFGKICYLLLQGTL